MNEREIFAAALDQTDEARAAFLESACAGDMALRERIEALLREQGRLGKFLEIPPAAVAPTIEQSSGERLGEKVGQYKLLQQIGEGGMGAVYLAEQTAPVVRRVALKIIKPGMDTRQVIARFEAERQALALMDHPHIAKVLDAGATASGRPYFVMELVKGVPITQYCDQQHLTPRERLQLFLPVCQAIQHAHQKGIIHRDLKPSNVLVALYDGVPVPKVIDFGVAKATSQRLTEKTMFTEVGSIVGTLEYMAPEQAELNNLDIDTRADLYSLGVLLYELLTGTPPFSAKQLRSAAFDEMLRMIREDEPPRPSTRLSGSSELPSIAANRKLEPKRLTRLVQGDLDWIVMKCLEKQRQRRYETANGLALDVERYLHDEPVLAGPPSATYRLQKFLRRHRGMVAAASLIVVALLLGAAGTIAGLVQVALERTATKQARKNADTNDRLAKAATKAEGEAKLSLSRAQAAERELRITAYLNQAREFRTSGQPGQKFDCLAEIEKAVALNPTPALRVKLRNEAIAALALTDLRVAHVIDKIPAESQPIFDRRFERCVSLEADESIVVRDASTGSELLRVAKSEPLLDPWSMRFTDDSGVLITTHSLADGNLETRLLDLNTRQTSRLPGYLQWISPDRRRAIAFLTRARDEIVIYNLPSGKRERTFTITKPNTQTPRTFTTQFIAVSPDGTQLAAEGNSGVEIWDLATGTSARGFLLWHGAWHPSGALFAGSSSTGVVTVLDVRTGEILVKSEPLTQAVLQISFHPGGQIFLTKHQDNSIRLWNTSTGKRLMTLQGAPLWQTEFSPDGQYLGWTTNGGRREIWQIDQPFHYCRELPIAYTYLAAQFSSDNSLFGITTDEGGVLWHVASGRKLFAAPRAWWVAFDRPSGDLLTSSPAGLHRWPLAQQSALGGAEQEAGHELRVGPPQAIRDSQEKYGVVALSADSRRGVASNFRGGEAWLLALEPNGTRISLPFGWAANVAISPDGRWAVTAPYSCSVRSKVTRVWNAATGEAVHEFPLDLVCGENVPVAFSGDSRWLATATEDACRLWKTGTWAPGAVISRDRAGGIWSPPQICFSRDGKLLVVPNTNQNVQLVDPENGHELASFKLATTESHVGVVALSDDNSQLAIASTLQGVAFWNLAHVRQELVRLGLDWEQLPLPAAQPAQPAPRKVIAQFGDYEALLAADMPAPSPAAPARTPSGQVPPAAMTPAQQIAFYTQKLARDPSDVEALTSRARAHLNSGGREAALADCLSGLQHEPGHPVLLALAARASVYLNQIQKSAEFANRLLALPANSSNGVTIGMACQEICSLYQTGRYDPEKIALAVKLGERAVELRSGDENTWPLHHSLGNAYLRVNRLDDAVRELEIGLLGATAADEPYQVLFSLASVEHVRRNTAKAQAYFEQGSKWCDANPARLKSLGAEEFARNYRAGVEAALQRAPPGSTWDEQVAFYTERLAKDSNDPIALLNRGFCFVLRNDRCEAALADFEAGLKLKPDHPGLLEGLAWAQSKLDHPGASVAAAKRLLAVEPGPSDRVTVAQHCNNLSATYLSTRHEQYAQLAAELGQRAVALQPEDWVYHQSCGIALYRAGRWDEAVSELEASLKSSTALYNDLCFLAMAEQRRGNAVKGLEYLEQGRKWNAEHGAELNPGLQNYVKSLLTEAESVLKEPVAKPDQK